MVTICFSAIVSVIGALCAAVAAVALAWNGCRLVGRPQVGPWLVFGLVTWALLHYEQQRHFLVLFWLFTVLGALACSAGIIDTLPADHANRVDNPS